MISNRRLVSIPYLGPSLCHTYFADTVLVVLVVLVVLTVVLVVLTVVLVVLTVVLVVLTVVLVVLTVVLVVLTLTLNVVTGTMVKVEIVEEKDAQSNSPYASTSSSRTSSSVSLSSVGSEELNGEESFYERIVALADIIPPSTRQRISTNVSKTASFFRTSSKVVGNIVWIVTTSALLIGLPLALSLEDEAKIVQQEKEMMAQQQGAQSMLAPSMYPPTGAQPPQKGVVPPGF